MTHWDPRTTEGDGPGGDDLLRRSAGEEVEPLLRLRGSLARRWPLELDVEESRERILSGLVGYDPAAVITSAGELGAAFRRVTVALEAAGVVTNEETQAIRDRRFGLVSLVMAWVAGEPLPADPAKRGARIIAGVVGSSILMRASGAICAGLSLRDWKRSICPCCGSAPDFATATADTRLLVCARCDTNWPTREWGCLGCGETSPPTVVKIELAALGVILTVCHGCGRYLKEPLGDDPIDPLTARWLTGELDIAAERRGLRL